MLKRRLNKYTVLHEKPAAEEKVQDSSNLEVIAGTLGWFAFMLLLLYTLHLLGENLFRRL